MSHQSTLTALAGEYAVCSELCKRGWLAMLPPAGHRLWDVLATKGELVRRVQVKTTATGGTWILSAKHEVDLPGLWFVFVSLIEMRFWVVPCEAVADYCRQSHAAYLAGDPRRRDSAMRKWHSHAGPEYEGKWELLEIAGGSDPGHQF